MIPQENSSDEKKVTGQTRARGTIFLSITRMGS